MVSREGKWPLAATIAVVLATVLLAACGGSDSSSSTEPTSTGSTTAQDSGGEQSEGGQKQNGAQNESKDQGRPTPSQDSHQSDGNAKNVVAPLEVSGGGSAQFRTKGGDISCSVHYTNKKTGAGEYRMTATLSKCNKPLRDGMRLQIGDSRWFSKLQADPSARITNSTAVFEGRSYGYLGVEESFYIDDRNINIDLPWL